MTARAVVAVLIVLGGVLPAVAVLWGLWLAQAPYRDLARRKAQAIEAGGSAKAMEDARLPINTWGDMQWGRTDTELARLKGAVDSYGWPVAVGLIGVACATAAGVWSLYL